MEFFKKVIFFFYRKIVLHADFKMWEKQFKFLCVKKINCNMSFLICSIFTMPATLKFEIILSTLLYKKNYSGYILIRKRNKYYEKLISVNPNCKILSFDDFIGKKDIQESKIWSKKIIDNFKKKKILIKKQVLSTTLRKLRKGSLNLKNNKEVKVLFDDLVEYQLSLKVAKKIHRKFNFDILIINEKGYTPASEIFDSFIKKRKTVIQWVSSVNDDAFVFKKYNYKNKYHHPFSLDQDTWKKNIKMKWPKVKNNQILSKIKSFYKSGQWFNRQDLNKDKFFYKRTELIKELKVNKSKKTAVIFSHIFYDATFFFGRNIYFDYQEWLIQTVKIAIQNKNINWILKVHPVNIWRSRMDNAKLENLETKAIIDYFGEIPKNIKIIESDTKINTLSFIEFIDYGITVRGTIGLELSSFGKIVVTAGTGRYDGNGFTLDPKSKKEYEHILLNLHKYKSLSRKKINLAQKFFEICYLKRPIKLPQINFNYKSKSLRVDELKYNLKILSKDESTFFGCKHITHLTEWMINKSQRDILKVE